MQHFHVGASQGQFTAAARMGFETYTPKVACVCVEGEHTAQSCLWAAPKLSTLVLVMVAFSVSQTRCTTLAVESAGMTTATQSTLCLLLMPALILATLLVCLVILGSFGHGVLSV